MCESEYAAGVVDKFRAKYPIKDGWEVFCCWPDRTGPSRVISELPKYLKEKRPDWIANYSSSLSGYFRLNTETEEGADLPQPEWTCSLKATTWTGELEISMAGEPLHCISVPLKGEPLEGFLVMIAHKNKAAVEKLLTEASRWWRSRIKKAETITVIKGKGCPSILPRPGLRWSDLILPGGVAEEIRTNLESFFKAGARYKELGLAHKRGFLLAGPPGNGKTLTARIIASDPGRHFTWFSFTSETDDDAIEMAFQSAADSAPGVLLFEDLDRIVKSHKVSLTYLLNRLDGMSVKEGVLVLATSNAPEKLDPALLHRPSRFDRVWNIGLPDRAQRLTLLKNKGAKLFSEAALDQAAADTKGFSMAYTQEVITNAMLAAITSGGEPSDVHLRESMAQLHSQFKSTAAKDGLSRQLKEATAVGFSASA